MLILRPFQKKAIDHLLSPSSHTDHLLCISPTGSGKSLIYENVMAETRWKTLIISPLIALGRQHHQKLTALGIPSFLSCGQSQGQGPPLSPALSFSSSPDSMPHSPPQSGAWIMSPESLQYSSRKEALQRWKPDFLVVDECHCLWEWGQSFRPAFQHIPQLIQTLPSLKKTLWLTATLPYPARQELRSYLSPFLSEMGEFDLPSRLHLSLRRLGFEHRLQALLDWVRAEKSHGMIFVSTREATQKLARVIQATGTRVMTYHGGMSSEERRNTEACIQNKIPEIVISTSAFGMGMDYSHIHRLALWQAPTSILSFVQIIGRVGRGNNSQGRALAFWDLDDFKMLEWSIHHLDKRRKELQALSRFYHSTQCRRFILKRYFHPETPPSFCQQCDWCDERSSFF